MKFCGNNLILTLFVHGFNTGVEQEDLSENQLNKVISRPQQAFIRAFLFSPPLLFEMLNSNQKKVKNESKQNDANRMDNADRMTQSLSCTRELPILPNNICDTSIANETGKVNWTHAEMEIVVNENSEQVDKVSDWRPPTPPSSTELEIEEGDAVCENSELNSIHFNKEKEINLIKEGCLQFIDLNPLQMVSLL